MRHRDTVQRLNEAIRQRFGIRLYRTLVFGSVARDTDRDGSDIDVMVILDIPSESLDWHLEREVRNLAIAIELADDVVFDLKVVSKEQLNGTRGHTPFMETVMDEGVAV